MTERRRRGASWSSNCFQTSSAFGFLIFIFRSRVGIRGVESSKLKVEEKERLNAESKENTEKKLGAPAAAGAPSFRDESSQVLVVARFGVSLRRKMGRKKKKGKTASSRSFTRELVYHNQNALQVLFSGSFGFQRQVHGSLPRQLSGVCQGSFDIRLRQRRAASQNLTARNSGRDVVNYSGNRGARSSNTRSAMANGRIHTNSISAVLHVPILNPFSASCATIILREVALGGAHASAKRSCKRPPFPISRNQNQSDWQDFRTHGFNPALVPMGMPETLHFPFARFPYTLLPQPPQE